MELKRASRVRSSLKICLSGPSGSGKTFSALQLAFGITGSWEQVCVVDTEQGSASLYSNLGPFNVIELKPPFHPESYIEAIKLAVDAGMKTIVIDSISHEWSGKGGCLELHEKTVQAVMFYGFIMFLNSFAFFLLRRHVEVKLKLIPYNKMIQTSNIISMSLYALSMPLAYVSVYLSYLIFIGIPVWYFIPDKFHK